jgi:hypothetical protein
MPFAANGPSCARRDHPPGSLPTDLLCPAGVERFPCGLRRQQSRSVACVSQVIPGVWHADDTT